jgi:hypothetical protein
MKVQLNHVQILALFFLTETSVLSSHLYLGSPRVLSDYSFSCISHLSHTWYIFCQSHLPYLAIFIVMVAKMQKIWNSRGCLSILIAVEVKTEQWLCIHFDTLYCKTQLFVTWSINILRARTHAHMHTHTHRHTLLHETYCDTVTDNCEDSTTLRNIYSTFEIQKSQTKLEPNEVYAC